MSDAILQAGLQGVQGGLDQFGRAASQIASTASLTNNTSAIDSLVAIKQAQQTVEASAKVISVADALIGTLIDERA